VVTVSIDGVVVAPEAATISVFDRGLLYGDGLFEVVRTLGRAPVDLAAQLDRLYAGAAELALAVPPRDQLVAWIDATLGDGDQRVRIIVTRGPGALSARWSALGAGRTIIVAEPLGPQPTEVSLAIVDWPIPRRAHPAQKTLAFVDHLIARELAAAAGADEAVRLDADGHVAECATANLFAVIGGTVVTPPVAGILPGVTRARVLAACADAGILAAERTIRVPDLRAADEIFVTSALRGVVPVTRLDGESRPAGPVTARLATAYFHAMRSLI
jgi:branched-chain amino acid aminotransferase